LNQSETIKQYAKEIPNEVRLVLKALNDDARIAVIIALIKHKQMSFTQLKEHLGLSASSLSNHLAILQDSGLVNNFLKRRENSFSYYATTDLAKSILSSLFDSEVKLYQETGTTKKTIISEHVLDEAAKKTTWAKTPVLFRKYRTRTAQTVEETPKATIVWRLHGTFFPKETSTDDDEQPVTVTTKST
jgi:DNA-binding transcriptional ArsR family regulator